MPPIRRFRKEDIINIGLEIVEEKGFDALNARTIAKRLGCSVQPLFHNFANMDELKENIFEKMYDVYIGYMTIDEKKEKRYKEQGLGYIRFAREHPEFFKAIFMKSSGLNASEFVTADDRLDDTIKAGQLLTGFSYEEQKAFHIKVWIFTHGIACLVATDTIKLDEKEIEVMLESTVRAMLKGFKKEEEIR